ncbi:MAG: hypothetical protein V4640_16750 [Verrucomicrobiota bacterium]
MPQVIEPVDLCAKSPLPPLPQPTKPSILILPQQGILFDVGHSMFDVPKEAAQAAKNQQSPFSSLCCSQITRHFFSSYNQNVPNSR